MRFLRFLLPVFCAPLVATSLIAQAQETDDLPPVGGSYVAPIYASGTEGVRSYLRLHNPTNAEASVTVYVLEPSSGSIIAEWTKAVPAYASAQTEVADIEDEANINGENGFSFYVLPDFDGHVQHVIWNDTGGSLTNISTCGRDVSNDARHLINVHTTEIAQFPSVIVIHNAGEEPASAEFQIYDSSTGEEVSAWESQLIDPGASVTVDVSTIESELGFTPDEGQFHLNFVLNELFTGSATHLVNNLIGGVLTNMTDKCDLREAVAEGGSE